MSETKAVPVEPICQECGMMVEVNEYHPFAACLMFKGCHDSNTVRANLAALTPAPSQPAEPDELARLRLLMAEAKRDFHGKGVLFSSWFLEEAKEGEPLLRTPTEPGLVRVKDHE